MSLTIDDDCARTDPRTELLGCRCTWRPPMKARVAGEHRRLIELVMESAIALERRRRPALALMRALLLAWPLPGRRRRRRAARRSRPRNGRVYTLDASRPWAEGLAITGDRIAAVGTTAEMRKRDGATDAHHRPRGRLRLARLQRRPRAHGRHRRAAGRREPARRPHRGAPASSASAARRRGCRRGAGSLRGDWGAYEQWGAGSAGAAAGPGTSAGPFTPDRRMIDAVSPDHPVFVNRFDRSHVPGQQPGPEAGRHHGGDPGAAGRRDREGRGRPPDRSPEGRRPRTSCAR